ncbi:zinc knuckle CX2CX4HX4C containing protein [Tanacetum coccineum]
MSSNEFIRPKKLDKNSIAKPLRSRKRNIKLNTISKDVETKGMEVRDVESDDLQEGDLGDGKMNSGDLGAHDLGSLDEAMNVDLEGNGANIEGNDRSNSEIPIHVHLNNSLNPGMGKMFDNDKVIDNDFFEVTDKGWNSVKGHVMNDVAKPVNDGIKNKVRSNVSFASVAQGMTNSGNNKLKLFPILVDEVGNKMVDLDPVMLEGSKKWELTVIGYLFGMKIGYREISGHLRWMWRMYDLDKIIVLENGLHYFKFKSKEGISRITSRLGTPIIMDRITTSMCEQSFGRASFARVLIKVDATEGLVDSINACYKSMDRTIKLKVEYAWIPPVCAHCVEKPNEANGDGDGWKYVSFRKEGRNGSNYNTIQNY